MMKLVTLAVLLLLTACMMPSESQPVQMNHTAVPVVNVTPPQPEEIVVQVEPPEPAMTLLENVSQEFAQGLSEYDAALLYPTLYSGLTSKMTEKGFAGILLYFKPKNRADAVLQRVDKVDDKYIARYKYGSDYFGWKELDVPLVQEDGNWHMQWFESFTTHDGLVAACSSKLAKGEDDDATIMAAKELAASSCMEAAALAINDPTVCPYAVHDRDRCYRNLGVVLTKDQKVQICVDQTGVSDNATISKCLWDLAVKETDAAICRAMPTTRMERYFCLGEVGAALHEPYQCNDAINDYTMRVCLKKYIDTAGSSYSVCDNPAWAKLVC